jgi:hypothetical protein
MDGNLLYNINKSIKDDKIDYVVMGTEGASGWSEFSRVHTGNVLTDVDVPILCIIDAKYKKTETIGFTTRFRPKIKALKSSEIGKMAGAKVKCLYVKTSKSDVDKKTIKKWEMDFEQDSIEFFVINSDEVKETILDFILYKEIDI